MKENDKSRKTRRYEIKELAPYLKYLFIMGLIGSLFLISFIILALIQTKLSVFNQQTINAEFAMLSSTMLCFLGLLIYLIPLAILFIRLPKEQNLESLVEKTIKKRRSLGFYLFIIGVLSALVCSVFYITYLISFSH
ncbi:MAG: hypothetical protein KGD64_03445 [Candidatus Heimdallarchaeota archaeon]|nr:hypothetical protein [Candidatus Heimdallarchaeota archaeon]